MLWARTEQDAGPGDGDREEPRQVPGARAGKVECAWGRALPRRESCPGGHECCTGHTVRQACGTCDTTRGWGHRPLEGLLRGQSHGEGVRGTRLLPPSPGRRVQGDEGARAVLGRRCGRWLRGPLVCARHAAAYKPELRSDPEGQAAPAEFPATLTARDPSHPHRVNSPCQGPGPHRGDQGSGQPGLCADTHKHGHLAPAHTRVHTRARTHACPPCARAHAHTLAAALAGRRPTGDRMAMTEGPLLGGRWHVCEQAHPLKPRFRLSCVRFMRTPLALLSPECDSQVWVRPQFAFLFPGDACLEAILGIPLL